MITVICGPMFSGKTTELFRLIRNAKFAGKHTRIYKYENDTRYRKKQLACSHDGNEHDAIPINTFEFESVPDEVQVIGIDEGQFIKGLVEFCDYHANAGKHVIVSGLDSDFRRNPFNSIIQLISKAEHVEKLSAVCIICGNDAFFSRKLMINSSTQQSCVDEVEDIGGAEKYLATCRKCFTKEINVDILKEYQQKVGK